MRPLSNIRFQTTSKRKTSLPWKVLGKIMLGISVVGGLGYLFVFSPVFAIRDIHIQDFERLNPDDIKAQLQSMVEMRQWGMQPYRDILLFNGVHAEQELARQFPSLKEIRVQKKYFHALDVSGIERMPIGIWCRSDGCKYFDEEGATWGKAIPSSGALLTVVQDNRQDAPEIDSEFFESFQLVTRRLPELGIALKYIEIPSDVLNEFRIHTGAGYYIAFALDSNVARQLEVLRIFLENKKGDPSFHPEKYIDLRIDGRVYYDKGTIPTPEPIPTVSATPII